MILTIRSFSCEILTCLVLNIPAFPCDSHFSTWSTGLDRHPCRDMVLFPMKTIPIAQCRTTIHLSRCWIFGRRSIRWPAIWMEAVFRLSSCNYRFCTLNEPSRNRISSPRCYRKAVYFWQPNRHVEPVKRTDDIYNTNSCRSALGWQNRYYVTFLEAKYCIPRATWNAQHSRSVVVTSRTGPL